MKIYIIYQIVKCSLGNALFIKFWKEMVFDVTK